MAVRLSDWMNASTGESAASRLSVRLSRIRGFMADAKKDKLTPDKFRGRVLIIAGSDSGGGAGIQADIKTVTALGGYAATAITALTIQNTLGVSGVVATPRDAVRAQMEAVLKDIGADALKTGMLGDKALVETMDWAAVRAWLDR